MASKIKLSLLCCFLALSFACGQESSHVSKETKKDSHDIHHDAKDEDSSENKTPDETPVVPVAPSPSGGGEGTGGGSQGALKPARTGNPDQHVVNPHGECGNGTQEVLPKNNGCPFDIYGSTIVGEGSESALYGFYFSGNGTGGFIANIGPNIRRVSAIDFSPDGVLYGVGESTNDGYSYLFTIDCHTGQVSNLHRTNIEDISGSSETVTDIDFDSVGRLFAYVKIGGGGTNDRLVYLSPTTGQYVALTDVSGLEDSGNGIASTPFPGDTLYHAGANYVSSLDKISGIATPGASLDFDPPADYEPRINAMDADPFTNILYASVYDDNDEDLNYLTKLDVNTGSVTYITYPPHLAPYGLDGLTVNRRYEECDSNYDIGALAQLPEGTGCSEDCHLIEITCDDYLPDLVGTLDVEGQIDNDQDGLANCDDPDCLERPCNDNYGCSYGDTCVANYCPTEEGCSGVTDYLTCRGTEVDCEAEVGNECTVDTCQSTGDNSYQCNSVLDEGKTSMYGSCTPEDSCKGDDEENTNRNDDGSCPEEFQNQCLLGVCVDGEGIYCEGTPKEYVPVGQGGCADSDICTADICLEDTGICEYGAIDEQICNPGGSPDM